MLKILLFYHPCCDFLQIILQIKDVQKEMKKRKKEKKRKLKKENHHHDKKTHHKEIFPIFCFQISNQKIKLTVNYRDLLSEVNWAMTGQQRA